MTTLSTGAIVSAGAAVMLASAAGANLVPNPGFEAHSSCPTGHSQIALAAPWSQPTLGTPDYFNACGAASVGVPNNLRGSEYAHGGDAYAGIFVGVPAGMTYREYLEAPLTAPLVGGQAYEVSFYVSLADPWIYATDSIGAYFSAGSVGYVASDAELPFTPQVENPAGRYLDTKTGWMLVKGTFTAAGGEDHIVIGNFKDNPSSGYETLSDGYLGASFLYIDDVSVEAVPAPGGAAVLGLGAIGAARRRR